MKHKRISFSLLIPLLVLTSCNGLFGGTVTLYLNYDNGKNEEVVTVPLGFNLKDLTIPERENSIFTGWYQDINWTIPYNSSWVTSSRRLYASYDLNVIRAEEAILNSTLSSVVTVEVHSTKTIGSSMTKVISQGSGVIFHHDESGYYALTNNHVTAEPSDGHYEQEFFILDYHHHGLYTAVRIHEIASYDLAIVRFESDEEYHVSQIEDDPLYANRDVVAIGSPLGVFNTITYGRVKGYAKVEIQDGSGNSNVDFPVIVHSALIDHGSSGGPLFDYKLDLVGINYASAADDRNDPTSAAIPSEKVLDYLEKLGGIYGEITPV